MNDREWFSILEVADWLRVHQVTIRKLIKKGSIKSHRIGSAIRFRKSDIEDYLEKIATKQ